MIELRDRRTPLQFITGDGLLIHSTLLTVSLTQGLLRANDVSAFAKKDDGVLSPNPAERICRSAQVSSLRHQSCQIIFAI